MATTREVKHTVSPTLHIANITSIAGYEEAKSYVAHSTEAMDTAYQAIEHVQEARQKLQRDESRTQKSQVLMAAQMADKYLSTIQKKFESSWDRLTSGINHMELELSKPMELYAGIGNVASEIRAHSKSMETGKRMKFILEALESGDEKTLKSVLGAPAYLSGMSEVEQQGITRKYHSNQNPQMASRLDLMKQVRGKLEQAKPIVIKEMQKAVGVTIHELEKLKATNNEAEAALVLKEFSSAEG
jgi:DNA-binding phage protein/exonuclease VII small subunit